MKHEVRPRRAGEGDVEQDNPGILVLLLICSSLAGCLWPEVPEAPEVGLEVESFGAYSVVAPIDTGINVYHDRFILNETLPDWLLDGLGVTMWCNLTQSGTWQERMRPMLRLAGISSHPVTLSTSQELVSSGRHRMMVQTSPFWMTLRMDTGLR